MTLSNLDKNEIVAFSGKLFCLGDSHGERVFWYCKQFTSQFICPVDLGDRGLNISMYKFGITNGADIKCKSELNDVQDGDALLFSFGWIDTNRLISKQINTKKRDLEEVVNLLVDNYFNAISSLVDKKVIKIIYSVVPPIYEPGWQPLNERIEYTKKLNETLAKECAERNWDFLDIYTDVSNEEGLMPPHLAIEHHIRDDLHSIVSEKLYTILKKYMK